jgi:broad specificity phosphatase PhoE
VTPIFDERLREKSAGELEGQPLGTTDALAKKNNINPREFRPPRGEAWTDVQARARNFLMDLSNHFLNDERKKKVLVVSHGGWIMEFINVIREIKGQAPVYANKSKNTAVYVYRFKKNGNRIVPAMIMENDTRHLNGL